MGLIPYVLDGQPGLMVVICQLITTGKKTYLSLTPTINVLKSHTYNGVKQMRI